MKRALFLITLLVIGGLGLLKSQESSEKFVRAEELIDNGFYLEATQLLQELCNEDDKNYLHFKELGYAYLNLYNYENAITNFSKATELNPECIKCYSHMARAWYELGDFATAESIIAKGLNNFSIAEVFHFYFFTLQPV